jgi:signal transduction histidine kinase
MKGSVLYFNTDSGLLKMAVGGAQTMDSLPLDERVTLLAEPNIALRSLLTLLTIAVGTILLTPWVVRRALASVETVVGAASRIDPEARNSRLPIHGVPKEIGPLVSAVNDALCRLDNGYAELRRFTARAAHELRTPLAILRIHLDELPDTEAKRAVLGDVRRLTTLVDQLLSLARFRARADQKSKIDLVPLARRVVADRAPIALSQKVQLEFSASANGVAIRGDPSSLESAISNLIDNAIAHSTPGQVVQVHVSAQKRITVIDHGEGLTKADLSTIFKPFYRSTSSRRGYGLGLAIVQEVVELHGGTMVVEETPSGGATFKLEFGPSSGDKIAT